MTTPDLETDPTTWQSMYSSSEAHWRDLERIGQFLIPIIGLIFLASIYSVVGFAFLHINSWVPEKGNQFTAYLTVIRIAFVVLLPFIAAAVGMLLLLRGIQGFIRVFYQLPPETKLKGLIQRRLLGIPPLPPPLNSLIKYPFITLKLPELDEYHWARWLGGPATLVVYDGAALYLERGSQFSRVVGPGMPMPFLDRYERIKEVVDLRPQVKIGKIMPWTKDGIQVMLTLRAECQIYSSPEAILRSSKFVYPFDPIAVKNAVEHMTVKVDPESKKLYQASWVEGAWGSITGYINAFVASHSLDELFVAPQAGSDLDLSTIGVSNYDTTKEHLEQLFAPHITADALDKINNGLIKFGSKVQNVQITKVEIHKDVYNQRAKYWESLKAKVAVTRNSRAEAERIRARESVHAEAQRMMLRTITEKLQNIDAHNLTEPLLLSLSGLLDQGLDDPIVRPLVAKESLAVLDRIRKMLNERF